MEDLEIERIFKHTVYTGEVLKKAVFEIRESRPFYIQSLIPEKSTTMFYAPDGEGKSMVLLQAILEATSDKNSVFGGFPIQRPLRSIIIMTERPKEESLERIKLMSSVIDINWDNIIIEDGLRGLNILKDSDQDYFIQKIAEITASFYDRGGTDILLMDTIYGLVSKGLATEEGAGCVNTTLRRLQARLNCAIVYSHHSNRGQKNKDSGKREGEDMYGSRFLSANCTGVFKIKKTEKGTVFTREKDTLSCLAKTFDLTYDHESNLSIIDESQSFKSFNGKIDGFIKDCFKLKRDFTFEQLHAAGGCTPSHIRDRLSGHLKTGSLINLKDRGQKALYRVIRV